MQHKSTLLLSAVAAVLFAGCRGEISHKPPVHIVPNMDFQQKLKAQSQSKFAHWKDGRGMRKPVAGTIARDQLGALDPDPEVAKLHTYKTADGKYVEQNPVKPTMEVLERGRERFDIHCAVCHGLNGRGHGIVAEPGRLPTKPPSFLKKAADDRPDTRHDPRVLALKDAEIFEVITKGKSTMQPYALQVTPRDRWAIVHYIRALQNRLD